MQQKLWQITSVEEYLSRKSSLGKAIKILPNNLKNRFDKIEDYVEAQMLEIQDIVNKRMGYILDNNYPTTSLNEIAIKGLKGFSYFAVDTLLHNGQIAEEMLQMTTTTSTDNFQQTTVGIAPLTDLDFIGKKAISSWHVSNVELLWKKHLKEKGMLPLLDLNKFYDKTQIDYFFSLVDLQLELIIEMINEKPDFADLEKIPEELLNDEEWIKEITNLVAPNLKALTREEFTNWFTEDVNQVKFSTESLDTLINKFTNIENYINKIYNSNPLIAMKNNSFIRRSCKVGTIEKPDDLDFSKPFYFYLSSFDSSEYGSQSLFTYNPGVNVRAIVSSDYTSVSIYDNDNSGSSTLTKKGFNIRRILWKMTLNAKEGLSNLDTIPIGNEYILYYWQPDLTLKESEEI